MQNSYIPQELMNKMRSSVIFMGAILARMGKAKCSYPGGCELGARPINLHLKAFRSLGVDVKESHGQITCNAKKIKPTCIHLDFPSVGATENVMLASCLGNGITTVQNAAREPEIDDLQAFLNAMGAKVSGAGTSTITIEGVASLNSIEKAIMPDRIVASTFLAAVAATGGDVEITGVNVSNINSVISILEECGAKITKSKSSVRIFLDGRLHSIDLVQTMPYPGFPTDAQAQIMAALTVADGTSIIKENIFENRFKHVSELTKTGADISLEGRAAIIRGVKRLQGANLISTDLRGGAALVIAALAADGISEIDNIHLIDRGYENLEGIITSLGGNIKRVK